MDFFYDIVKVIAPIATIIVSYLIFHNKEIFERNKSDYDRIDEFIENMDKLKDAKEYKKDISVASINILKGFTFVEAKIILDKNLSRKDIIEIRDVKVEGLCVFAENKVYLCDKKQFLVKLFKDVPLILLVVLLLVFLGILFFSVNINEISMLIYIFFIEVLLAFKMSSYTSYFSIVKDEDRLGKQGIVVDADKFEELKNKKISTDLPEDKK